MSLFRMSACRKFLSICPSQMLGRIFPNGSGKRERMHIQLQCSTEISEWGHFGRIRFMQAAICAPKMKLKKYAGPRHLLSTNVRRSELFRATNAFGENRGFAVA